MNHLKSYFDVIIKPIITEKSTAVSEKLNCVFFQVDDRASKEQIKKAVESFFSVTVLSVNTLKYKGYETRFRGYKALRSGYKKAMIRLQEGQTIELGI